ncbi:hypothetical protein Tco_0745758 [Tanacetum coccineum]
MDQMRHLHTRSPIRTTWVDPKDGVVYTDIECDIPSVHSPVQSLSSPAYIPSSPGWSLAPSSKSPASLTVPTPIALPATSSPAASPAIAKNEGFLAELGAQIDPQGSILQDHTQRLDALLPTLLEVLALEASAGQTDAQRAALWQARYEDQREIHALRLQHTADQREMQGLRERVATLERRMDHFERQDRLA